MGFSLKKAFKAVAKVAAPAIQVITSPIKIADKAGLIKPITKATGVDLNNIRATINSSAKLEGSTGSDSFKKAFYDSAKIGAVVATGGGALTTTQGAGALLLTSKIQNKGGATLGDIASVAGVDTSFGGIDLGGIDIIKKKANDVASSVSDFFTGDSQAVGTGSSSRNIYIGIGVITLVTAFIIIRKKR
jgi:hypothetical protein